VADFGGQTQMVVKMVVRPIAKLSEEPPTAPRPPKRSRREAPTNQRTPQILHVKAGGAQRAQGAFTQYIGSTALDAANLMMAIVGFLPVTDPRIGHSPPPSHARPQAEARNQCAASASAAPQQPSNRIAARLSELNWPDRYRTTSEIDSEVATSLGAEHQDVAGRRRFEGFWRVGNCALKERGMYGTYRPG
jgi:hypothetical protein